MEHYSAGLTDVGKQRDHNEDALLVDEDLDVYLVCDGVGGHAAGEVASQMTIEAVQRVLREGKAQLLAYAENPRQRTRDPVIALLESAINTACREVWKAAQEDPTKRGMASTIVLMAVFGSNVIIAHVGDSRIYLCRKGQVHQITDDHSLISDQIRVGVLAADQAGSVPWKNVITRVVGFQESVQVDTLPFEVMPGDTFLLCSDGLGDYLHDGVEFLEACRHPHVEEIADELVRLANDSGGKDNITAVVIRFEGEPPEAAFNPFTKMETLKRIPLFAHLTARELMLVLSIVNIRKCAAGEQVVKEGEIGNELFVSIDGEFEVQKEGRPVTTLASKDFFGEMALIDQTARSATIVATKPALLLAIGRPQFNKLLLQEPVMATKLLLSFCHVLSERIRAMTAQQEG